MQTTLSLALGRSRAESSSGTQPVRVLSLDTQSAAVALLEQQRHALGDALDRVGRQQVARRQAAQLVDGSCR